MKVSLQTKHTILYVLIGVVSLLIVVSLAVGVSVIRSGIQQDVVYEPEKIGVSDEPLVKEEILIEERMEAMHEEGNAEPTAEELERMERMNATEVELSAEEEAEIAARMQRMLEAE